MWIGRMRCFGAVVLCLAVLTVAVPGRAEEQNVCISCHGALPGKFGEPVPLWKESVHAANGIACNDCHGGNPRDAATAMSPAMGFLGKPKETDIPAFCGRCHVGVLGDFQQSAHGKAVGRGGPTCVTCHGNHRVVKASLDIINEKRCGSCHDFQRAAAIRESMLRTESRLVAIDRQIRMWQADGGDTSKMEKELFAVRNRFHSLFHEVNVERMREKTAGIGIELDRVETSLKKLEEEKHRRRIVGAFAAGGALFAALLFHLLRKTYD